MDNIIEPNETFDFSKLSLSHPIGIQGNAYFTKIEYNKKPLYIQTFKSLTRQGFVKSGKKYYCDLMFDKNSEKLIHWFEKLEEKCQKLIYEKKESWFQNNLEESDIEIAFNPVIRVYKSGKYYLVRVNIKNTKEDLPAVKIYNENKITLSSENIKDETEIISILEIQGIKFTTRNFQIDIELKQVMVLDNDQLFEKFLINSNSTKNLVKQENKKELLICDDDNNIKNNNVNINEIDEINEINEKSFQNENNKTNLEEIKKDEEIKIDNLLDKKNEDEVVDIVFEELKEEDENIDDGLREINNEELNLEKTNDSVLTLKKPNQVYFELYKEAKKKAKEAKKNVILAYLEAKNIKKTYMIENMNDSDSDFDNEIDEVSESELEGL